jgi:hypothetical protein
LNPEFWLTEFVYRDSSRPEGNLIIPLSFSCW